MQVVIVSNVDFPSMGHGELFVCKCSGAFREGPKWESSDLLLFLANSKLARRTLCQVSGVGVWSMGRNTGADKTQPCKATLKQSLRMR